MPKFGGAVADVPDVIAGPWALALLTMTSTGGFDLEPAFDDAIEHVQTAHPIRGRVIPSLVALDRPSVGIEADRLEGAIRPIETSAAVQFEAGISHPFDADLRDVRLSVVLMPDDEVEFAWKRLMTPPLELTEEDLSRRLARPVAHGGHEAEGLPLLEPGTPLELDLLSDLGELELDPRALPGYVAMISEYTLEVPSARDIERILDQGTTPDLAALAQWISERAPEAASFDAEERRRLMAAVDRNMRRLRAPPAYGDVQRLNAMIGVIEIAAGPDDLERLLELERPLRFLLTGAALSYDDALREEALLELPVHGMHLLPSRSEFLRSSEVAMQGLRRASLDRLVRLAFDPLDFRDSPAESGLHRSPVQPQAARLLQPLEPTNVTGMLAAADHDVDIQREILGFYVRAHHRPVVEPLVQWLLDHPEDVDGLGGQATTALGEDLLPALLRHFVDPSDREHRRATRRMLLDLPATVRPRVIESFASLGIAAGPNASLDTVLDAYETAEKARARERADELLRSVVEGPDDLLALPHRVRAAARLAEIDPSRLESHAPEVIELHVEAALELDVDAPAERDRALAQLGTLPLGGHAAAGARAKALTESRLAARHGEPLEALKILTEHDPELGHPDVRSRYDQTVRSQFEHSVEQGRFAAAHDLLAAAEQHFDPAELAELGRQLFMVQYKPAMIMGALFGLTLLGTLAFLVFRATRGGLAMWRKARAIASRIARRKAFVQATADEIDALRADEDPDADWASASRISAIDSAAWSSADSQLGGDSERGADAEPDVAGDSDPSPDRSVSREMVDPSASENDEEGEERQDDDVAVATVDGLDDYESKSGNPFESLPFDSGLDRELSEVL